MTDEPTDLDKHRGMAAQQETERRRNRKDVEMDQLTLKERQEELEHFLTATPARSWAEAAEKVRYLLDLFGQTPEGMDPRRRFLMKVVLDDFDRLLGVQPTGNDNDVS
ncbi:MAG TPA: hypothetical protein VM639_02860 [Dongiaceae bacterium]|nr:hypothetical protein [Dongiaceae bacterium]